MQNLKINKHGSAVANNISKNKVKIPETEEENKKMKKSQCLIELQKIKKSFFRGD